MHCQLAERFAAVLAISCSYSFSGVSEEAKEKPGIAVFWFSVKRTPTG